MATKYTEEAQTGDEGIAFVRRVAAEAGFIFRSFDTADVGIDGAIELLDDARSPTGDIILVQVKSGASFVRKRYSILSGEPYAEYFDGVKTATGLHVGEVHVLEPAISLPEIRALVPGFVPPQGLLALRDAWGRYEHLLRRLSCPLPADIFPQEGLFRVAAAVTPSPLVT